MLEIAVLGVDLGKNSCSVVGLDAAGRVVLRRRLHRDGVVGLAAGSPGCMVAMEACCGAHHLGRRLREAGHEVRLMSPEYVRPYVKLWSPRHNLTKGFTYAGGTSRTS